MPARLDKPLRPRAAVKTAKAKSGEEKSLHSLLQMNHGCARSARAGGAMRIEMMACFNRGRRGERDASTAGD
jgi:hypothetical protein